MRKIDGPLSSKPRQRRYGHAGWRQISKPLLDGLRCDSLLALVAVLSKSACFGVNGEDAMKAALSQDALCLYFRTWDFRRLLGATRCAQTAGLPRFLQAFRCTPTSGLTSITYLTSKEARPRYPSG